MRGGRRPELLAAPPAGPSWHQWCQLVPVLVPMLAFMVTAVVASVSPSVTVPMTGLVTRLVVPATDLRQFGRSQRFQLLHRQGQLLGLPYPHGNLPPRFPHL